jgi:hypothetical protein
MLDDAELPFWAQLNDAFPLLRRLVLVQHGVSMRPIFSVSDDDFTFRNLELLISGIGIPFVPQLRFPRLRHIAPDIFSERELEMLTSSPLLESVLFRRFAYNSRIDLNVFPHLRYLGVPAWETHAILPAGKDHPLEHLSLRVDGEFDFTSTVQYIMGMAKVLPRVSRITLDVPAELKARLEIRLQNTDLPSIWQSVSNGASRIVLKRAQMDPG